MLRRRGINHSVLNAKNHQNEAMIVAQAGQPGSVTVATNMAGRGTDIKLGAGVVKGERCYLVSGEGSCQYWEEKPGRCHDEVPCGLLILGTERHEARRIDDQLRGRSARQGDPGSARFYLSLEDDLMRLFGGERVAAIMDRWGAKEDEPIEHSLVTRAIAGAQKRVEIRNAEIRRHLLEYDDVMNRQRELVYSMRDAILREPDLRGVYDEVAAGFTQGLVARTTASGKYTDDWDWEGLRAELGMTFLADLQLGSEERRRLEADTLREILTGLASRRYDERKEELGPGVFGDLCRFVLLRTIDSRWRDHLYALDMVREGIGLRAYGQKDPLVEYKQESFKLFDAMMMDFYREALTTLFRAEVRPADDRRRPVRPAMRAYKPEASAGGDEESEKSVQVRRTQQKVGRNDPCPCGSGKKYKRCCGSRPG
jgi:preprotein translocase subunit SecA